MAGSGAAMEAAFAASAAQAEGLVAVWPAAATAGSAEVKVAAVAMAVVAAVAVTAAEMVAARAERCMARIRSP